MKLSVVFAFASTCVAAAALPVTGMTGGGQPFDNMQPSLAVTQGIITSGIFPSAGGGGSATGDTLGFIYNFAGNYSLSSATPADGQILPIQQNQVMYAIITNTYGGNAPQTFALPNLAGRVIVGSGTGPGLTTRAAGDMFGSPTVTLSTAQLPPHNHALAGGKVTGTTGGGQAFDNTQPSTVLHPMIATSGAFPSNGGGGNGQAAFLGEVAYFAGNYVPSGWTEADGHILSIQQNQALFAILGTQYGGDGKTTFALPDLRGRVIVGASASTPNGTTYGQESTTLSSTQMPAHDHTLPGGSGNTGTTGGNQPLNNDQPSIAMNYIIDLFGAFPTRGGGINSSTAMIGDIVPFAGNFAPVGWAFADGQLLSISQDTELFSIIGTMYGGDGKTTFALPDLQGRVLIGADGSNYVVGGDYGSDTNTLSVANLPPHDHTLPVTPTGVPEPLSLSLMLGGLAGLGTLRRKKSA